MGSNIQWSDGFRNSVRWKFNALTKKYKECVDNNSASGRGAMTFEFYDQLEEIFGQQSNAIGTYVMSSTLPLKNSEASILKKQLPLKTSELSILKKQYISQSDSNSSTSASSNIDNSESSVNSSRNRPQHGSGSNKAKMKLELEKQWSVYLQNKENRDSLKDERYAKVEETKREMIKLKKRQILLKEKELECRKEIAASKRIEKTNRHAEIIEIERQK